MSAWFVRNGVDTPQGPFTEEAVRAVIESQAIGGDATVSPDGGRTVMPLTAVPTFAAALNAAAAAAMQGPTPGKVFGPVHSVVIFDPTSHQAPRRMPFRLMAQMLAAAPETSPCVVQIDGRGPWLPAVLLLRTNPQLLPEAALPLVIGLLVGGLVLTAVQVALFGPRSLYGLWLPLLICCATAVAVYYVPSLLSRRPTQLVRDLWASRRQPLTIVVVCLFGLGELVALGFGVPSLLLERRVESLLAASEPCSLDVLPQADLAALSGNLSEAAVKRQAACVAARAGEVAAKAKAEFQARCASLAEHLLAGKLTDGDKSTLKGDDAKYVERVQTRRLDVADLNRSASDLPCADSPSKPTMWKAHVTAASSSVEAWAAVTPSTPLSYWILREFYGGGISAEAGDALAASAERAAVGVVVPKSLSDLDGYAPLCRTVVAFKLKEGPLCARANAVFASLERQRAAVQAATDAREKAKNEAEERAAVARAAAEEARAAQAARSGAASNSEAGMACIRECNLGRSESDRMADNSGAADCLAQCGNDGMCLAQCRRPSSASACHARCLQRYPIPGY